MSEPHSDTDPRASGLDWGAAGRDRSLGLRLIVLAYAVALLVAVLAGRAASPAHPLEVAAWADAAATVAVFAFSFAFRNSSFYDAYWSVAPPVLALYWISAAPPNGAPVARQALCYVLVLAWAARLTWNWWRGWTGLAHEDWRYRDIQARTGSAYWLVSLSGIHMFPTLQVFAGCLGLWPALASGSRPLGALDVLAAAVTGGAIALEATADRQLHRFRANRGQPDALLESGLWGLSRHPNYLGEIGFWWGVWLFGVAADPTAWWWTLTGPVLITAMFYGVSLPLIETHMLARRPHFAELQRRIPKLIPRIAGR